MRHRLLIALGLGVALALVAAGAWLTSSPTSAEPTTIAGIAPGNHHTCALTTAGGVKCWGRNLFGQLGNGTNTNSSTPVDVSGLTSGVAAISSGGDHSCALTSGGGMKCWGYNASGQLGNGLQTSSNVPVDVTGLTSGVQSISVGSDHTCAVLSDTSARCWGLNNYGQGGNNTSGNSWLGAVHVCASGSGFGCTGGAVLSGIARISAGGLHTCLVTTGGALKCFGMNYNGQLGIGVAPTAVPTTAECTTGTSDGCRALPTDVPGLGTGVADVSAGGAESCAVLTGGGVKCWGYNAFGQVGNGTKSTTAPNYPEPTPQDVTSLSGIEAVQAGGAACALSAGGAAKCWGLSDVGQVGDGTTTMRTTPVDVFGLGSGVASIGGGSRHNCAVMDSGGAKCWGANDYGQLGNGTTTGQFEANPFPVDVLFGACTIDGFVFDGNFATDTHQNAIKGAKVELLFESAIVDTTVSGSDGSYSFNCAAAGDYQVRATLEDGEPGGPVFDIRYLDSATEPVWVQRNVTVDPGDPTVSENLAFADVYATQPGDSNVAEVDRGRLDDMGNIFYRTRQYVDWIDGTVGAFLSSGTRPLPVEFYTFSTETTGAFYRGSETLVKLGVKTSLYSDRDVENDGSPENGEWHEFGHHIYQANISDKPFAGTNHNGYLNSDTSDSLSEATPEFLSMIAWHAIVGGSDDSYDDFGSMEPNGWKAWSSTDGLEREELAVLGVLWDLHDSNADSITTKVVKRDGSAHTAVTLTDNVDLTTAQLWFALDSIDPNDPTVAGLRDSLFASAIVPSGLKTVSIDLDGDAVNDVAPLDIPFLMHGFYEIDRNAAAGDVAVTEWNHRGHYWVGNLIGRTDHVDADGGGPGTALVSRRQMEYAPGANVMLDVQNELGSALPGTVVQIEVAYPEMTGVVAHILDTGAADLVYLELPPYSQSPDDSGGPLPSCDPSDDYQVTVLVTVTYDGRDSLTEEGFDNCEYLQAVEDSSGAAALELAFTVPSSPDVDSDGILNPDDNCPFWPNPGQALPVWPLKPPDYDCDGFSTSEEEFVGTNPYAACAGTATANDEADDRWSADLDDNQSVNILDILQLTPPVFNTSPPNLNYSQRKDLNGDGAINILDILRLTPPVFNQSCAP